MDRRPASPVTNSPIYAEDPWSVARPEGFPHEIYERGWMTRYEYEIWLLMRKEELESRSTQALQHGDKALFGDSWIARQSRERHMAAQRVLLRVERAFDMVELLVPRRLASEEIGDALEVIPHRVQRGCPTWQIYAKAVTTIFWILVHAAHEVVRGPAKQKGG